MDAKMGSVKKMSEEAEKNIEHWRDNPCFPEIWDKAVAPFKKVEWVPRDSGEGKQLVMSKE